MTLEEAILARHSVRQYRPTQLTVEQVGTLQAKIEELNDSGKYHFQLIANDEEAFTGRMAHYGKFRGVNILIALVGKKDADLDEGLGYGAAQLVLLAQQLGLNTCIVGLTYRKTENFKIGVDEILRGAIALGVGETQGHQHPMKAPQKIAPDYDMSPDWFRKGIDTVLLAPSALNQFKARFVANPDGSVTARARLGFYTKLDLGIFKYYFEAGCGLEKVEWK